jgi:hypothetical protein
VRHNLGLPVDGAADTPADEPSEESVEEAPAT